MATGQSEKSGLISLPLRARLSPTNSPVTRIDILRADPELVEPGKKVHVRLRRDFIATANQAARDGVLDIDELTNNIAQVADLARASC